jgi:hypothetical protein
MTDTISILSKPRIKCFAANNKPCNVLLNAVRSYDTTIEKNTKLTEEGGLWTRESIHCICNPHVEQYCTFRSRCNRVTDIHYHGSNELCNCILFRIWSMKITSRGGSSN